MTDILKEAKRLHDLGFALLWLRPKSKAPIKSKWTSGPRDSWENFKAAYAEGQNLGVRLGSPSVVGGRYLAVFDVDVKSDDPVHQKQADEAVAALLAAYEGRPTATVMSGRGNGSRHIYVVTSSPVKPQKLRTSLEKVKVMMPSTVASGASAQELSAADLAVGFRIRPAWEIALMGEGQQVVLPPSTHPDSGRMYAWGKPLLTAKDLILIDPPGKPDEKIVREAILDWTPVPVDIICSEMPDSIVDLILYADCEDRSAALFSSTLCMVRARFTDQEIMSVLTDKTNALGLVAYEHTKNDSRKRAANWIYNYTIKPARAQLDLKKEFESEVVSILLSDEDARTQEKELVLDIDWELKLDRNGDKGPNAGKIRDTLKNVHLILTNAVAKNIFKFNEFVFNDEVWAENPWGIPIGTEFQERSMQDIRLWFANKFGFQPSEPNMWSAITTIANQNKYHPVRDYLRGLPVWDGVQRVDTFLERCMKGEAPEKYLRAISRKTICAMVARVLKPGIKFDCMLILEGPQGLRKSTAIKALASGKWFSDADLSVGHKDAIHDMHGKWVFEQGELNVLDRHDISALKRFVAREVDRMRPSHARKSQDFPRQCIFIGSTNDDIYLKDQTGNRRFWPFKVTGECDIDLVIKDRDQIFAEALMYWELGEPLWLEDKEIEKIAKRSQDERTAYDEVVTVIEDWLESEARNPQTEPKRDLNCLRMIDLFADFGPFGKYPSLNLKPDTMGQRRVGDALRVLGYSRTLKVINKKVTRFWIKGGSK